VKRTSLEAEGNKFSFGLGEFQLIVEGLNGKIQAYYKLFELVFSSVKWA
jgi:hypothetical protein